jgi:hypothetical protein
LKDRDDDERHYASRPPEAVNDDGDKQKGEGKDIVPEDLQKDFKYKGIENRKLEPFKERDIPGARLYEIKRPVTRCGNQKQGRENRIKI